MFTTLHPLVRYAKRQWFTYRRRRETNVKTDYLFFYMIKGFFTYEINGKHGKLLPGEGLLIPPGNVYTIGLNYQEMTTFNVLNLELDESNIDKKYPLEPIPAIDYTPEMRIANIVEPFNEPKVYTKIEDLGEMIEEIVKRFANRDKFYQTFASTLFKLFLMECELRQNGYEYRSDMLTLVENYFEDHYKEQISNSDIAEALSYHPYYISSTIKKLTGYTLREYLLHFRLDKAKRMLRQTQLSITEISSACGFTSHSYFSMTFSHLFGLTPSEYRKKHYHQLY